jgi:hypothetical protein
LRSWLICTTALNNAKTLANSSSHIMQRLSLAHFSRQLSLRYVDLPLPRARHSPAASCSQFAGSLITHHAAAVARALFTSAVAAFVDLPPGRYQFIIMQRGPPRIGIPHLVATKFKLCSGVLYLRALGIPTWPLPSLQSYKEKNKINSEAATTTAAPTPRSSRQIDAGDGTEGERSWT